ncbi:DUF881 domain-containing protein [uncultured Clostridium sp.]|uniref:DUF881 domain-containing protein n=1 Tax=uncultured Clostridium sp. TaxID=59620 RepID=UPI002623B31D|nr:DUF881 domain-containing protein [uncultured Clostridium sp.]
MKKILILILAVISGFIVSMGFNINRRGEVIGVNEYEELYEERTKILSKIGVLERENKELNEKIDVYEEGKSDEDETARIIEEELKINRMLIGEDKVAGEGVIIKLEDGFKTLNNKQIDSFIRRQRTIHNNDIVDILNDIKIAGGEAISINDRRIILKSSVYCAGQFLVIDGYKTPSPFYIKVLGDSEMLEESLMADNSSIKKLINREIKIDINREKNIKITEFTGKIDYTNIKK